MSHIVCHSLRWCKQYQRRCAAMLRRLHILSQQHEAKIVILGNIMDGVGRDGRVNLADLDSLRVFIQGMSLYVVPAHEYDKQVCELLNIPYVADDYLDGVYCMYQTSINERHTYSCKNREHIPALIPSTFKEYSKERRVLLWNGEKQYIPFRIGPKIHEWSDDLSMVRGGDLVVLRDPSLRDMAACRVLKLRGARIRIIQQRQPSPLSFWDFFEQEEMDCKDEIREFLESRVRPTQRMRMLYMKVENIGPVKSLWIDMSGSGIIWVGGENGSGKRSIFVHIWCWLMLGVWRGHYIPESVGVGSFVECKGLVNGVEFTMQRRVTEYEHMFRCMINGVDMTRETPEHTTCYFHREHLHWEGRVSSLYERWMQLLVMRQHAFIICPHVRELRTACFELQTTLEVIHQKLDIARAKYEDCKNLVEKFTNVIHYYAEHKHAWDATRDARLLKLENDHARLSMVPEASDPGSSLDGQLYERLQEIAQMRAEYFSHIRRRRMFCAEDVSLESNERIQQMKRRVEHAKQEQDARRIQVCSLRERINIALRIERAEIELQDAIDEEIQAAGQKFDEETKESIFRLSKNILETSTSIDKLHRDIREWNERHARFEKYQRAREQMRCIEEKMMMTREDNCTTVCEMQRLIQMRDEKSIEMKCLKIYIDEQDFDQRQVKACMYVNVLMSKWKDTWYKTVDEKARALWNLARWGEEYSLHNAQLYKNGCVVHCSQGQEMRRLAVYFLATKYMYQCIPYMVIDNVDNMMDIEGRAGLERLVSKWCDEDATRTCWWLTRTREGSICLNGV